MLNGYEIVLIFALVLLLFGAKKLPELARGLGQGLREFKNANREVADQLENAISAEPNPSAQHLPGETELSSAPKVQQKAAEA